MELAICTIFRAMYNLEPLTSAIRYSPRCKHQTLELVVIASGWSYSFHFVLLHRCHQRRAKNEINTTQRRAKIGDRCLAVVHNCSGKSAALRGNENINRCPLLHNLWLVVWLANSGWHGMRGDLGIRGC